MIQAYCGRLRDHRPVRPRWAGEMVDTVLIFVDTV